MRPTIGRKPEVLERRDRERERAAATAKTAEQMDLQDDETMDAVVAASIESHGVDLFVLFLNLTVVSGCCLQSARPSAPLSTRKLRPLCASRRSCRWVSHLPWSASRILTDRRVVSLCCQAGRTRRTCARTARPLLPRPTRATASLRVSALF